MLFTMNANFTDKYETYGIPTIKSRLYLCLIVVYFQLYQQLKLNKSEIINIDVSIVFNVCVHFCV